MRIDKDGVLADTFSLPEIITALQMRFPGNEKLESVGTNLSDIKGVSLGVERNGSLFLTIVYGTEKALEGTVREIQHA